MTDRFERSTTMTSREHGGFIRGERGQQQRVADDSRPASLVTKTQAEPLRFMSREACLALLRRAHSIAVGGGVTGLSLESRWMGNLRWARNEIWTSGDIRNNDLWLTRDVRGAQAEVTLNRVDDASVHAAVRRVERLLLAADEGYNFEMPPRPYETPSQPDIWSDATYGLDAEQRAAVLARVVKPAANAGVLAAGYLQVAGQGRTVLDSQGQQLYYPYTTAQYTVTVRDPKAHASGWAGVDHYKWTAMDPEALSAAALDKCLRSRNPVAVEPGRYTTILEPQAVCDLCSPMLHITMPVWFSRGAAEAGQGAYAHVNRGGARESGSRIGEQMLDERLTITADPMDPQLGFVPFDRVGNVYHPAVWFEHGVLKNLPYYREYAIQRLGQSTGLPSSGAFNMSGGTTSIEEMIATTKRGIFVTRFSNIEILDGRSILLAGYTRDGTWLIENGKITKAVKNFRFTESPLFALNNIEQLGVPRRVFHPKAPVVVPPMKVRDFSFTALSDAV